MRGKSIFEYESDLLSLVRMRTLLHRELSRRGSRLGCSMENWRGMFCSLSARFGRASQSAFPLLRLTDES
jgi:hypothetical protein